MKYFKNTELAKLYNISEKTVRNWIRATQDGKLWLQLYNNDGHLLVANTSKNIELIEQLVNRGKKYKNTRGLKVVTPVDKFYETYNQKQVLDIISDLTIHSEMPVKYTFLDGGADYWDQYANRLAFEQGPNLLNRTLELLDITADYLDHLVSEGQLVNIIDLGPGNGLPIRPTLERFVQRGVLNRYIALDISQEIIDITEKNVKEWFGDKINFEGYVKDLSYERFDDLFEKETTDYEGKTAINLVYMLGGTLSNFRSPDRAMQAINSSMSVNDLLIYDECLDTPKTRLHFDVTVSSDEHKLSPKHKFIWDFLGIDESLYEVDHIFSEEKLERSIRVRPVVDISLKFELPTGPRFVELRKNQQILMWRHWHFNVMDIVNLFDRNSFDFVSAARSQDQEYFVMLARIKTDGN